MKTLARCLAGFLSAALIQASPIIYAEWVMVGGNSTSAPALGSGTPIPVPPNSGVTTLSLIIPAVDLPWLSPGIHRLAVRVRDQEENWTTLTRTLRIPHPPDEILEPAEIDSVEAFISARETPNNPIPGTGLPLLTPTGTPDPAGAYSAQFHVEDLAALPPGIYRLGVRARNASGLWSPVLSRTFTIPGGTEPQFYYPRWRIRDPLGSILHSGSFSDSPLETFPQSFAARLPLQGSTPGTYSIEVAMEDSIGTPGEVEIRNFQITTHASFWQSSYFTDPGEAADPGISGPDADPNGDGVPNLLSYLLGIDPVARSSPAFEALAGPSGTPRARLTMAGEIPPGGTLRVLGSPDLTSFATILEIQHPETINLSGGFMSSRESSVLFPGPSLLLTPPSPGSWDGHGFFRLEGELDAPWPITP